MYGKLNHYQTRNLDFTDIYKLVEPIKNLEKDEWLPDIYFINSTLKEYADLPADYEIKAFIEHAAQLSDFAEGGFRVHPSLPSIVPSSFRVSVIESVPGNNGAYAVGPYIAYAKSALSNDKLKAERERLSRNLLVFPAHSIRGLRQVYDIDALCKKIEDISVNYDSVRICLFWKDVLLGTAEKYRKHGFEVVTAGHYYDPMFMPRLKSIIETSTMTMSNQLGTHIGYCVYLNKPHFFINSKIEMTKDINDGETRAELEYNASKKILENFKVDPNINQIIKLFSKNQEFITEEQYNHLNKYWGFDQVKTPEQLRKVLLEIEGIYQLENTSSATNEILKLRNQLNAQEQSHSNEILKLKNQLNAQKQYLANVLTIKGYINYKTKNWGSRLKKNLKLIKL
jgi:hypothetical protein